MARRIQKMKVKYLSLCPRGANRLTTIYKSDEKEFDTQLLVKGMNDAGELTAIVYAPELRDAHGDIASAEVIKEAMYQAAKDGFQIDVRHNNKALDKSKAFVAQSFIVQKDDERFEDMTDYDGNPVDVTGSWGVVLKIDDEGLRAKYRSGEWQGVSLQGPALVVQEKSDKPASSDAPSDNGEIDMKPEELTAALTKSNEGLVKSITEGVATAMTGVLTKAGLIKEAPADDKNKSPEKKAPQFKGPITKGTLRKHSLELRKTSLLNDIDWTDADAVTKAEDEIADIEKELGEIAEATKAAKGGQQDDENLTPEQKQIKVLEKQIADLRGRSNQPAANSGKKKDEAGSGGGFVGLNKEDEAMQEAGMGSAMAAWSNKTRGYGA